MYHIAMTLFELSRYDEAKQLLERALALYESTSGKHSEYV